MIAAPSRDFVTYLGANARRYFPDLDGAKPHVELVRSRQRTNSWIYSFRLTGGGSSHEVVAKVRRPPGNEESNEDSLLIPSVAYECRLPYEHGALAWIQEHIEALADPRFGAVRVLDLVPEHRAFVMEAVPGQNLGAGLDPVVRNRARPVSDELLTAIRNSGGWLSAYHRLPSPPQSRDEPHTREALMTSLRGLLQGVALDPLCRLDAPAIEQHLLDQAHKVLPRELPAGTGHGDYHPGNVLADATGRVFVIDTCAAWRGPIHYDISRYLFVLKTTRRQLYQPAGRRWPAALDVIEKEFLRGYFDAGPVPIAAIRLFEIQQLLHRWSSSARAARWPGLAGWGKRARLTLKTRAFRDLLERLMRDLDARESLRFCI